MMLKKPTLSELVSELHTIHKIQTKQINQQIIDDDNYDDDIEMAKQFNINLRKKINLNEQTTVFELLKQKYYSVNSLIARINFLTIFEKHELNNDLFIVISPTEHGINFVTMLHKYYKFKKHPLTNKLQGNLKITETGVDIKHPLVSFEKKVRTFLKLNPTLIQKIKKNLQPAASTLLKSAAITLGIVGYTAILASLLLITAIARGLTKSIYESQFFLQKH